MEKKGKFNYQLYVLKSYRKIGLVPSINNCFGFVSVATARETRAQIQTAARAHMT